jgi:hypothetical protein
MKIYRPVSVPVKSNSNFERELPYVIGLAGDLNLLGRHLAQDPDGNTSWRGSVLAQNT